MTLDERTDEISRLVEFHEKRVAGRLGEGSEILETGLQLARFIPTQGWATIYAKDAKGDLWKYQSDFFFAEEMPDLCEFSKATGYEKFKLKMRTAWDKAVHGEQ